jgi:hypothetical protein
VTTGTVQRVNARSDGLGTGVYVNGETIAYYRSETNMYGPRTNTSMSEILGGVSLIVVPGYDLRIV